jgi:hypothetical protein
MSKWMSSGSAAAAGGAMTRPDAVRAALYLSPATPGLI